MTFVDTDVLLDLATNDPQWSNWSLEALQAAAMTGILGINAVVHAELSARYRTLSDVEEFLERAGLEFLDIPPQAAFLAARAFGTYRAAGGTKSGVLSDFFIGAHASVLAVPVLTRDVRHYRTYFPDLRLIAPNVN